MEIGYEKPEQLPERGMSGKAVFLHFGLYRDSAQADIGGK